MKIMSLDELRKLGAEGIKLYEGKVSRFYRRERLFDEALKENYKILQIFDERVQAGKGIDYQDVARLEYEIAYIYTLTENTAPSVRFFECSIKNSEKANDPFGSCIARFRISAAQYLAGIQDPALAIKDAEECRTIFARLSQEASDTKVKQSCIDWVYNTDWRIFDVAAELGDRQRAQNSCERIKAYIKERGHSDTQHEYKVITCEGLLNFVAGKHGECLEKLAKIIDFDLSEWGMEDPELIEYAKERMGLAQAREYLFAGRALMSL